MADASHTDIARKIARSSEYSMGNKTALLRSVSRQVGRVIRPRTIAGEEVIMAYHDERSKMYAEKIALQGLERSFRAANG